MDFNIKYEEIKLKRKLEKTANNISKNRKNEKKLRKENQAFEEIKKLLNTSDNESPSLQQDVIVTGSTSTGDSGLRTGDSLATCAIPIHAPEVRVFDKEKIFLLYDHEGLCLKNFHMDHGKCELDNKSIIPDEHLFRDSIAHRTTEAILPKAEGCPWASLYVLYLMSVHPDPLFASKCLDFLKFRRFKVSASDLLPIFVNFGSSSKALIGSSEDIKFSYNSCPARKNSEKCFPYYNLELVAHFILFYSSLDLIENNSELKLFVKAIARLTLDSKIRFSRLFSVYSLVLSVLSNKLTEVFSEENVSFCLHLEDEDILNQVEIVRIALMPINLRLREFLIIRTINAVLKTSNLNFTDSIKVKGIKLILKTLIEKNLTPVEVYCILQLVNCSLPSVTATTKDAGDINNLLVSIEATFYNVKDSVDLTRLKLEVAKVRNFIVNNVEN